MSLNTDNAVYLFIEKYSGLPSSHIVKGWQDTSILPEGSEQYAVFTAISSIRRGTNLSETMPDVDAEQLSMNTQYIYQVDIVTSNGLASDIVNKLNLLARSDVGVQFFKAQGVTLLYGDNVKAIEMIGTSERYLQRYMIELHLEELTIMEVEQDYFNIVEIEKLKPI